MDWCEEGRVVELDIREGVGAGGKFCRALYTFVMTWVLF